MILNEFRYEHISGTDGLPLSVLRIEPDTTRPVKVSYSLYTVCQSIRNDIPTL